MKFVPFVLLLVLAGGCEIWDPRPGIRDFFWGIGDDPLPDPNAEIRKKEYPTWPKEIREAVDARLVLVGMTRNQVLLSVRLPEKDIQKQVTEGAGERIENWTVWRTPNSWAYLKQPTSQMVTITFRDGKVVQLK